MLYTKQIKAVIFDWGGVCCKEGEPFASRALQKILNKNPNQIAEVVEEIYRGYYLGKYTQETFWRNIMRHFNLSETDEINPVSLSNAYLNSYEIYQSVLDVALKLQNKYKVGLLSNLTPEMRDNIKKRHNIAKYFKTEIYSCDDNIKTMKPDTEIFFCMLNMMEVQPSECLFIDNSKINIVTAASLGMSTILFESVEDFLQKIQCLL